MGNLVVCQVLCAWRARAWTFLHGRHAGIRTSGSAFLLELVLQIKHGVERVVDALAATTTITHDAL